MSSFSSSSPNRRSFLRALLTGAVGFVASKALPDLEAVEKALWVPGAKTVVLPPLQQFVSPGISIRFIRQYDIQSDLFPTRIDVLYGVATIRPNLACRILLDDNTPHLHLPEHVDAAERIDFPPGTEITDIQGALSQPRILDRWGNQWNDDLSSVLSSPPQLGQQLHLSSPHYSPKIQRDIYGYPVPSPSSTLEPDEE